MITLVSAGIFLSKVWECKFIDIEINNNNPDSIIETIKKDLEAGNALSKCFEKYPQYFDNVYCNLIKAGEASGKLDVFLLKIVESLEKKEKIKS